MRACTKRLYEAHLKAINIKYGDTLTASASHRLATDRTMNDLDAVTLEANTILTIWRDGNPVNEMIEAKTRAVKL